MVGSREFGVSHVGFGQRGVSFHVPNLWIEFSMLNSERIENYGIFTVVHNFDKHLLV